MKKLKYILIVFVLFLYSNKVYAASASLNVGSSNVYIGDSFTVSVSVSSAAAWNIHVSASGPVSGCFISEADATSNAMDTNKMFVANCTATGEGTINLFLSGDVTSASDGNAVRISESKNVTVSKKPSSSNNNNSSNTSTTNTNSSSNVDNKKNDNKSKNNNLKSITIDGYDLKKIDSNNYTLTIPNDVTNINIKASAEDTKAKVSGTGNHQINVGDNNIEVIITSESGVQNKIIIKVTRKDGFYLDDLDSVLKNGKTNDININIDSNSIIKENDVEKIKNSGKKVNLNYYNADKKMLYSWILDGSKIKNTGDLDTSISFDSNNKNEILKLSNYADGMIVSPKQSKYYLEGINIRLFVGDKFNDNDIVNIYGYNEKKLELISRKIKVKEGYVEFEASNVSDYLITMSNITKGVINKEAKKNTNSIQLIIIIILLLILIILNVFIIIRRFVLMKKQKKSIN
ncbi:MAG: cadherin-like beta sandwich domain-containing protein [Bacilli bacterium]|nr:cadherin-like beta sandwich domain-containing protein [Bacilli bacterium]